MVAESFDARTLMTITMTTSTIGLSLYSSKRRHAGYLLNRSARSTFLRKLVRSVPWRSSVFESPIRPLPADEGSKPNGLIAIQAALSLSANASI